VANTGPSQKHTCTQPFALQTTADRSSQLLTKTTKGRDVNNSR